MKVIHLISGGDSGGAKTHVLSLLQNLNKTITAQLVCFRDGPFAEEARAMGIPTMICGGNNIPHLRRELAAYIQQGGYQLIHCHGSRANMIGALLRKPTGLPVVSTVHSDYKLDYMGRPFARLTFGAINAWALRHLDYRIGVSDAMVDYYGSGVVTVRFRVGQPYRGAALCAYAGGTLLKRIPKRILTPGEMESFPLDTAAIPAGAERVTFVVEEGQA